MLFLWEKLQKIKNAFIVGLVFKQELNIFRLTQNVQENIVHGNAFT